MSSVGFTPGTIVGRYEIIKLIGAGGMAEVYLARVRKTAETRVAIKRLLPSFAHERRFIEMFVQEARLAATLQHQNIAKVFDVGVDHGVCYYAMEHVDGHDVRALLAAARGRERPMPLAISLSIMYGITCALAYVHDPRGPHARLNVVHRDISPSNILVSFDGEIKLVDFGIARVETGLNKTGSGQLKGKIPYMSPEQCRARALDGRSDLFSLGVVLYELTTNTRPFDRASEFETLEAIVRGEFTPPSRVVDNFPKDVEPIILRLLANRRNDRYASAGALLVDLDRAIAAHGLDLGSDALATHINELLGRRGRAVTVRVRPAARVDKLGRQDRLEAAPTVQFDPRHSAAPAELSAAARIPIDRVAAHCDEMLELVSPGTSDARDLTASAVARLIGRAMRSHARGDLERAVLAAEVALAAARPDDGIDALLASNDSLFEAVFTAYIGDQSRMAAVSQHIDQLVGVPIDQRAVFVLTRIDGTLTARELLATCGLPRRDALRHFCQLLMRELVVLV